MPRARRPSSGSAAQAAVRSIGRVITRAAKDVADRLAAAAIAAAQNHALPLTNRFTDVEVTVAGVERCTQEHLAAQLQSMWPPGVLRDTPVVIVLNGRREMEHVVVLQFRITLECPASQAADGMNDALASLVDGDAFLGYAVRVVGAR